MKYKSLKTLIIIILSLNFKASGQANAVTSIGAGYELNNHAVPVQLTVGFNLMRSEMVLGYTAFLHKEDAKFPKIIFIRYGINVLTGNWEIIPLLGVGMHTTIAFEIPVEQNELLAANDPNYLLYDHYTIERTPEQFKILYGLKIQKLMGLGGLFTSYEHCKFNYLNLGMFVRIN